MPTAGTASPSDSTNADGAVGNPPAGVVPLPEVPDQPVEQGGGGAVEQITPIIPVPVTPEESPEQTPQEEVIEQASTTKTPNMPLVIGVCLTALALAVGIVVYGVKKYGAPFSKQ
jgi:hypothetical protein